MATFDHVRDRLHLAVVHGMFLSDEDRSNLARELDALLTSISECDSIDAAENKLQELGQMQDTLATIYFGYQIDLTEKQRRLVREYDRWDLPEIRNTTFEAIKRGQFP